jgi:hypothetical protein
MARDRMSADEKRPSHVLAGSPDPESGDADHTRAIETVHSTGTLPLGEALARHRRVLVTSCPVRSPFPGLVVTKTAIHLRARRPPRADQ